MKYLKDCPEPGMGTWYFEIDSDGVAYRQIVIQDDGTYIASNRKHEQYHFLLAEKAIEYTEPYYTQITKKSLKKSGPIIFTPSTRNGIKSKMHCPLELR
ncbi:hypothetical protein [Paenibacillus polymyxa]|uniref:hypothetical protein n=1 Tax=Paenibacillus polymyxa TaxID=1406 RepID=UPI0021562118|nr:hypothetical protein [Paenibacillus polymyxa]